MAVVRRVWPVLLSLSLFPFAGWAAVRLWGLEDGAPAVQLLAFTPYVAVAALAPPLAALLSRRWRLAALGAVPALVLTGCVLPRGLADGVLRPGHAGAGDGRQARPMHLVTANLLQGKADPAALVAIVRDHRADVLTVQELTPSEATRLDAAGLATLMPYRSLHPGWGSSGSALYSRYPLSDTGVRALPAGHLQAYGTLQVPGARPVLVESAHPCAPSDLRSTHEWEREIALEPRATPTGDLRILVGDLNSTLDHESLRRLVGSGYRDAAGVVGAGLTPTWSAGSAGLAALVPPVTIDHVLADRRIGIRSVSVHDLPGSDHRAVYAELALPTPPGDQAIRDETAVSSRIA